MTITMRRHAVIKFRNTPAGTVTERTLASNTATTDTGSATTLVISPTGMVANDWLLFAVVSVGGAATHTNTAGGCTQVGSQVTSNNTTVLSIWKKKATGTVEPLSDYNKIVGFFTDTDEYLQLTNGTVPANKYAYIVVHWNIAGSALNAIKAAHSVSKVLAYQNLGGMIAGPHTNSRPTSLVTQEEATAHGTGADDWRLHKESDGTVVVFSDFTYLQAAHIGRASWRTQAASHFAQIASDGFHGVMFDDVNMKPGHGFSEGEAGDSTEFASNNAYRDAVTGAMASLKTAATAQGLLVVPNVGIDPWVTDEYAGYTTMLTANSLDGVLREFWTNWAGSSVYFDGATWTDTMKVQTDAEAAGKFAVLHSLPLSTPDDTRSIRYGLASFYLHWDGTKASGVGYNDGRPLSAFAQYSKLIGTPTEAKQLVSGTTTDGAWMRHYTGGVAIINAKSTAGLVTFTLGGTYLDPSGANVTSVQLDSKNGMVLLPGSYTFDVGGTARRILVAVRGYIGGDTTDIVETAPALQTAVAQQIVLTGVDPAGTGTRHLLIEASNSAIGSFVNFGQPANYTEKHDFTTAHTTNANACLGIADRALPDDTATGTKTFTITGGVNQSLASGSVLLKPATGGSGPPASGFPVLGHWRNRPIDIGTNWRTDMNAAEAEFGVFQGHWSQYKGVGAAGTLNSAEATALNDGKNLHIYWKPYSTDWAQVASGGRDAQIDAAAASIGGRSENIWLSIHHEAEDDYQTHGGAAGWTYANYRGMWQRVRDRFDLAGVTNVTWVWVFQTHLNHPEHLPGLWPGNSLVDIVAPQPYIICSASPDILATKWLDCLDWLQNNRDASHTWSYTDRPIAITEWGPDLGGDTGDCGVGGGDRGTVTHRRDAINGVTAALQDLADKNVVELRYFDAGSNYFEDKPSVDAVAYQNLKDATETVARFYVAKTGSDANPGTSTSPFLTIGAGVTQAVAANATEKVSHVIVRPGTYRETVTIPSGGTTAELAVEAEGAGVVISGADDVTGTGWTTHDAGLRIYYRTWTNNWGVQAWPDASWSTQAAISGWNDIIRRRELVVINGQWVQQVLTLAEIDDYDAAYFVDEAADRLYVRLPTGGNIATIPIEVGMRERCLSASNRTGLELRGFTFQHAVPLMQQAGVSMSNCPGLLVEDCDSHQHSWGGLKIDQTDGATVRRTKTNFNGVLGLGSYRGQNITYEDGEANSNNVYRGAWAAYKDWEDGGSKCFETRGITFRRYNQFDNFGPGFWWDTDNKNVLIEDCRSARNSGAGGIFLELTQGPVTIRRTKVNDCGRGLTTTSVRNLTIDDCDLWDNNNELAVWAYLGGAATVTEFDTSTVVSVDPANWVLQNTLLWISSAKTENLNNNIFGISQVLWDGWKNSLTATGNAYHSTVNANPYRISSGGVQSATNFAGWKSHLGGGRDSTSTFSSSAPSPAPTL